MDGRCECGQVCALHHGLYSCSRPDVAQARSESEVPSQFLEAARAGPDMEILPAGSMCTQKASCRNHPFQLRWKSSVFRENLWTRTQSS
eukprot:9431570-Pyramimonas_sp.AAC.1